MKKLPIGISTFKDIREDNYVYIDKTKEALDLIESGKYYFLSRPRRFGKSLFLDTLKNIFEGKKELFENLYIYDKYDFKSYPVIKISFSGDIFSKEDLKLTLFDLLKDNQKKFQIECEHTIKASLCFKELIQKTYEKYNKKVVILIDEYDKPILDNIEKPDTSYELREELKAFYTQIKENDAYIQFAFLTGVSKFAKVSIFSGLNNLEDITLNKKYATICGYTHHDIETSFKELLEGVNLEKLKEWYNGYNFLGESVYNPFDILLFISNGFVFKNYWFANATPTFLIKLLKKGDYFLPQLENLISDESLIESFDIENLKIEPILFQSGYLTIDKVEIDEEFEFRTYKLKLPNKEVQISFNTMLISYLTNDDNYTLKRKNLLMALANSSLEEFKETLTSLYASIPYNSYVKNNISSFEGYYASVFYVYISSLGLKIIAEDVTNRGRIDFTVFIKDKIYIFEFKVNDEDPLFQIKKKKYYEKYLKENKEIILVGINFDEKEKNVKKLVWEGKS